MNYMLHAISIAAVLIGTTAEAQMISVTGIGFGYEKSCADFLVASANIEPGHSLIQRDDKFISENLAYMSWANGFITGVNFMIATNFRNDTNQAMTLSASGIDLWLRNWCTQNPNRTFNLAVQAFLISEGVKFSAVKNIESRPSPN